MKRVLLAVALVLGPAGLLAASAPGASAAVSVVPATGAAASVTPAAVAPDDIANLCQNLPSLQPSGTDNGIPV